MKIIHNNREYHVFLQKHCDKQNREDMFLIIKWLMLIYKKIAWKINKLSILSYMNPRF